MLDMFAVEETLSFSFVSEFFFLVHFCLQLPGLGRKQCQWHMALLCVKHPQRAQVRQSWRRRMRGFICSITSSHSLNTRTHTENSKVSVIAHSVSQVLGKNNKSARSGLLRHWTHECTKFILSRTWCSFLFIPNIT